AKRLRLMRDHLIPGTQAFREHAEALDRVQARINSVRSGLGPLAQAWKQVSVEAKGMVAVFLASAFATAIAGVTQQLGDMDDQFADVQKNTDMTDEEIQQLNKDLSSLNTRT